MLLGSHLRLLRLQCHCHWKVKGQSQDEEELANFRIFESLERQKCPHPPMNSFIPGICRAESIDVSSRIVGHRSEVTI